MANQPFDPDTMATAFDRANGATPDDPESRNWTVDETREQVMRHFHGVAETWAEYPDMTPHDRCHGVVSSILATIDGSSVYLPPMALIPVEVTDHDDIKYHHDRGYNFHQAVDIAEGEELHSFYQSLRKKIEKERGQ